MSTQAEVVVTEPANCGITDTISYLLPDSTALLNNGGIDNNYYILYNNHHLHCYILYNVLLYYN